MLSFHFVLLFLDNALHIIHARAEQRKQQCLLATLICTLDLKLLRKHMRMDIIIRAHAEAHCRESCFESTVAVCGTTISKLRLLASDRKSVV